MNKLNFKILYAGLLCVLLVFTGGNNAEVAAQTTIWLENFDTLADETRIDLGFTAWSIDTSACDFDSAGGHFKVLTGQMDAMNTFGEAVWYSEWVDITSYTDVRADVDLDLGGFIGEWAALDDSDYIKVYYSLDNGPETLLSNGGQLGYYAPTTATTGGLNGDSLRIIVRINNQENEWWLVTPWFTIYLGTYDAIHQFDEVHIYEPPVPDPRYAIANIVNDNWNNTDKWSLTPGGPSCSCIPDEYSDVHIDNETVDLNVDAQARNITIYDGGTLQWSADDVELGLNFRGDIIVEALGSLDENSHDNAKLQLVDNSSDYTIDNSGTFVIDDLELQNEGGGLTISGNSDITITDLLEFTDPHTNLQNNSTADLNINNRVFFSSYSSSLMNAGTINITNDIFIESWTWPTPANDNNVIMNQAGGVLNIGTTIDCQDAVFGIENYGTINQTGGFLQVEADEVQIYNHDGATWNYSAASIDANVQLFTNFPTNTFNYNAAGPQTIHIPENAYSNLNLSNSGVKTSNDTLNINGNLTIAAAGVTLDADDNNIELAGDWTNAGTFLHGSPTGGTQTVTFDGMGEQSISNATGETFDKLNINNADTGIVFSSGNVVVEDTLFMNQGNINTGTWTLTLGTDEVSGDEGTLEHSSGTIIGKFERWIIDPSKNILFPVGTDTTENSATINFTDLTDGSLIVEYDPSDPGSDGLPLYESDSIIRYQFTEGFWDFTSANTLASNDFDLKLHADGFDDFTLVHSTRMLARTNGGDWELRGTHAPADPDTVFREAVTGDISTLGTQFGVGHGCPEIAIGRTITDVTCFGGSNGEIELTPSGGAGPYTFLWAHGPTSSTITGIDTGDYKVTVTDANSCWQDSTFTVNQPDILNASVDSVPVTCVGGNDGSITISSPSGGSSSYEYSIDTGSTWQGTGNFTALYADTFNVQIRDANDISCVIVLDPEVILTEPNDVDPPNALCKDITVQLNGSGIASITPAQVDDVSTDNCGIASLSLDITDFDCSDVGSPVTVTLTVEDVNGLTSTCTANVTVEDNVAPTAECRDITVQLDATGNVSIIPTDIDNGSSDACGIASLSLDVTDFDCSDVGTNTVNLTVEDVNGNTSSCSATVIVEDVTNPIALCQDITVQLDASGNVAIVPADIDNGSSDACGIASLSLDVTNFDCSDVGANTVNLTVEDVNGNTSSCSATVTVEDVTNPTALCKDITVQLDASGNVSITGADVNNGSNDACGIASLSLDVSDFDCSDVGANTVNLTVEDVNGNTSSCSATVTVEDVTNPTALCKDITVQLDASGNVSIVPADVNNGSNDACGIATLSLDVSDFDCSDVGANTVNLTVEDINGNTSSCSATVTVEDVTNPTALCQDITVQLDASGNVSIVPADVNNGSNDACGIASLSLDVTDFDCSDVGANTVNLTVEDVNGNTSSCSATVTVEDVTNPTALCQDITVQLDASGNVSITGADINNGSNDACGIASLSLDVSDFDCSNVGANTVNLTVEDVNGNTSSCSATVTVEDVTNPTALCQDITVQLDASGNVSIVPADVNNGSNDACGIASLSLDVTDFNCSDVGANTVNLTVEDVNGNSSSCTATVTVEDVTNPTAACQDTTVYLDGSGTASIDSSFIENGSTDNCGIATIVPDINSFSCTDVGANTVTMTVTDISGNTDFCTSTVTVLDTITPLLTCPPDRDEDIDTAGNFTIPDYTSLASASDNCGTPALSQSPVAGTVINGEGTIQVITITADDGNGNTTDCTFNVTLVDVPLPTITCPADRTENLDDNCQFTLPDYTGLATVTNTSSMSQSPVAGTIISGVSTIQTITLTAKNSANDSVQCSFNVTLQDTIIPTLNCIKDTIVNAPAGSCSAAVNNIGPATATDNCAIDSITYLISGATTGSGTNDASGTTFNKGLSTIWYKVTDSSGNADSCSFNVDMRTTIVLPDSAYSDRNPVCEGDGNIQLMYAGGTMVEGGVARWYDDALLTNVIGTGNPLIIAAPVSTTEYFVRFEGNCDTTTALSVSVVVQVGSTAPSSASVDRNDICAGDGSITLSYTGGVLGDGATAQWYSDTALSLSAGSGNNLTLAAPSVSTSYFVRFEGMCDTSSAASVLVNVYPAPSPVFAETDANGCTSGMLSRYVVSGLTGSSYTWSISAGDIVSNNGDSIMVSWGDNPGTHNVSVFETTSSGCESDTISTQVLVGGPDVDLGYAREICQGETAVITPTGNFSTQVWLNDVSTGPTYSADTTELVRVQVSDDYGCYAFDSVQVTMYLQPVVDLGNDTTLCGEASLVLDAGNPGATYLWSTGETTQQIEVFAVDQIYSVEVNYNSLCTSSDEITVKKCSMEDFFANIPNLITPNGDGRNDVWIFHESSQFPDIEVDIFDRWGNLVFRSEKGYGTPWDGKNMNGKNLPMDSYHYIIKVGNEYYRGAVTIVR